jgi:REP element-mobilizing transposase RayT
LGCRGKTLTLTLSRSTGRGDKSTNKSYTQHDRDLRRVQKTALRYDPVHFSGKQALSVARGIARAVAESGYVVFACSVLPGHVHMVVQRHANLAEKMIGHFKARATQQLVEDGLHPFEHLRRANDRFPTVWGRRGWKVYLDSVEDIERAIRYVEANPLKDGKKPQAWPFVTPHATRFDAIDADGLLL